MISTDQVKSVCEYLGSNFKIIHESLSDTYSVLGYELDENVSIFVTLTKHFGNGFLVKRKLGDLTVFYHSVTTQLVTDTWKGENVTKKGSAVQFICLGEPTLESVTKVGARTFEAELPELDFKFNFENEVLRKYFSLNSFL